MDIMKNMIKKSILLFCLLFGIMFCVNAQTTKYYSTDFAYKVKNDYGQWSDWSKWESSRCLITISLDRNVINIYSEEPQEFDIYDSEGNVTFSDFTGVSPLAWVSAPHTQACLPKLSTRRM